MEALLAAGAPYTSKVKHSITIAVRAFSLSHFIVRSPSWAIVLKTRMKNVCIHPYWDKISLCGGTTFIWWWVPLPNFPWIFQFSLNVFIGFLEFGDNLLVKTYYRPHRGGRVSASVHVGMPYTPRDQADPPDQADIPPGPGKPPRPGRPPPHPQEADSSIRSTSGRYASYWNAFLFKSANSCTREHAVTTHRIRQFMHDLSYILNCFIWYLPFLKWLKMIWLVNESNSLCLSLTQSVFPPLDWCKVLHSIFFAITQSLPYLFQLKLYFPVLILTYQFILYIIINY